MTGLVKIAMGAAAAVGTYLVTTKTLSLLADRRARRQVALAAAKAEAMLANPGAYNAEDVEKAIVDLLALAPVHAFQDARGFNEWFKALENYKTVCAVGF